MGSHPVPIVTGVYIRDTAEIFDHIALDEDAVAEQARAVLEDLSVQVIKVGFCGTPETLSTIAEITSDYGEVPVVAYTPNLSWWADEQIDNYLDAFRELMLPQTTLLVGHHNTLWRWLLPDWSSERAPNARDLARAAAQMGTPYVLVTGIQLPDQFIDNVLASAQGAMAGERFRPAPGFGFVGVHRQRVVVASTGMRHVIGTTAHRALIPGINDVKHEWRLYCDRWMQRRRRTPGTKA